MTLATRRTRPCSPVSHSCAICSRFVSVGRRLSNNLKNCYTRRIAGPLETKSNPKVFITVQMFAFSVSIIASVSSLLDRTVWSSDSQATRKPRGME
jgi:hypothetical protein